MTPGEWSKTPPPDLPFYPCWVTDGEHVFLASWRDGGWKIGKGLGYKPEKITHYQILKAPNLPVLIQEKL